MRGGAEPPLPKGAPLEDNPLYKRFALELLVVQRELVPGVVIHIMAYAAHMERSAWVVAV